MALIPLHVLGGAIAVLSGLLTLLVRKGGLMHRHLGRVFVYAILVMSLSGVVIAIGRPAAAMNIPVALVTAYLVTTALLTVQPPSQRSRRVERGAMLAAFALSAISVILAGVSATRGNVRFIFPILMFGLIVLLAGLGDLRMLRAGGLRGSARLRRHLWRMCTGLFIAAASFFLGPVRRIPEPLRAAPFRFIPLLVMLTMLFWLWRYRRRRTSPVTSVVEAI
jgi:uncharacterized membrane protein